jgi:indolepyruvate ferredoxin oxidoreductase beta subunit
MRDINFLVVGVGGQGALLASNVLAEVGFQAGFDVKKAEVHGMSQRGGSVNSHVRWGQIVRSPVIARGEVDILIALEKLESLRYQAMLKRSGVILVGEFKIPPLTVSSGDDQYPVDKEIVDAYKQITDHLYFVPSLSIAEEAGTSRAHNVVLLGALSALINYVPEGIWISVLEDLVPQAYLSMNQNAFLKGRLHLFEQMNSK